MINIDVLIVGGGPSGSSLGYLLQKNGYSCCIVDKCSFPRMKLCGGLLTKKTTSLINSIYGEINFPYECTSSNVNIFLGTHKISSVSTDSNFYLVERYDFDHYLIKKYKETSGLLYENSKLTSIDVNQNTAVINNTEEISYKILVGADGANSQIRKFIDAKYRPNTLCLECNYPSKNIKDDINIYLSFVRSGYAWCFPKKNHYNVGIGGLTKKNKNLKSTFISFLKTGNMEIPEREIKGAMIPVGEYVKKPCKDNILLVGDAAGLVDSITGEGIYFALLSAKYAYNSIDDSLKNNLVLSKRYLGRISHIQAKIRDANFFNKVYFNDSIKSSLVKLVDGRKTMIKYVCDNLISEYNVSYSKFPFHYLKERKNIKRVSG